MGVANFLPEEFSHELHAVTACARLRNERGRVLLPGGDLMRFMLLPGERQRGRRLVIWGFVATFSCGFQLGLLLFNLHGDLAGEEEVLSLAIPLRALNRGLEVHRVLPLAGLNHGLLRAGTPTWESLDLELARLLPEGLSVFAIGLLPKIVLVEGAVPKALYWLDGQERVEVLDDWESVDRVLVRILLEFKHALRHS
mgnify:CR=1 FL=1